jgi:arylformamidase
VLGFPQPAAYRESMIDITRAIHPGMAIYPHNPGVMFTQTQQASAGKNALTRIELGSHTGTHIDAPSHIHEGAPGAFAYTLGELCGPCEVIDVSRLDSAIGAADIPSTAAARLLFKTRNSSENPDRFSDDFVALDDSAAEELVRRGVQLVGLDALSIRERGVQNRVHETLIDGGVVILEGLWLAGVDAGHYELLCLPLKVDLDGAPVRAVLRLPLTRLFPTRRTKL